jgi:hypothetical protein
MATRRCSGEPMRLAWSGCDATFRHQRMLLRLLRRQRATAPARHEDSKRRSLYYRAPSAAGPKPFPDREAGRSRNGSAVGRAAVLIASGFS